MTRGHRGALTLRCRALSSPPCRFTPALSQHPPTRDNPVTPTTRSTHATRKASRHLDDTNQPLHSFRGLLEHMATLTRNTITLNQATFDKITTPTPTQHQAFELIGASIPLALN